VRRVLFIGDGKHDIGKPEWPTDDAFPARGVVPLLAERIAAIDRPHSVAMHWAHPKLARFSPDRMKTRGYEAKLRAAHLQVKRGVLPVEGIVCVVDEDKKPGRRQLPGEALELTTERCPIACGVAVRSIEAWTLGARQALADVLGIKAQELRRACPSGPIEELYEGSDKQERRPKALMEALARRFGHRRDSLELREEVAERTDIAELSAACPEGFAPFTGALRAAFGPLS